MTAAISMANELGVKKLAVPSAGNAAGAMAAYAAKAGMEAHIFMPSDTPHANVVECQQTGAHVTLIDGLITDCGMIVAERKDAEGWFDVSTLKEPYRVEGKKTMGYELAEQFRQMENGNGQTETGESGHYPLSISLSLPDVILYPTGGGTGLIGMWKAFDEMEQMGWIDSSVREWSASNLRPVHRSCAHSSKATDLPTNSRMPRPSPPAFACQRRSAIS